MTANRIVAVLLYLAIGALLHAIFVGSHLDWTNVWTWAWIFGWPVMVAVAFYAVFFALMAIAIAAGAIVAILER